ncbi:NAD(P)H-binding protein [Halobacillus sp. A1]|uniref:NAD(P)-dependent oxidoreductase n=1 Tax=Halobacillus sp. A1 TaxID=2880262 RepID=UPI0020A67C25|nr:NAD(P)H-binding protein [Halobacillus sp. A1]MCP3032464.1 NAD(P)H-binding protein [Halobacillus sp. A1]
MKIAVFGATGRVGSNVVQLALQAGWEIKALVRDLPKAESLIPGAHLIEGDATISEDVEKTIQGCDLVFSALSTDKTDTLSRAIPLIIEHTISHRIDRIITVGTAGILNSRLEKGKYRYQSKESKRRSTFAAEEHQKVYQSLAKSNLDWVILCPTYLPDGENEGEVRYEENFLPEGGTRITVKDTALFAFKEIKENEFHYTRVGLSY